MLAIRDNLEQCVSALYAHKLRASLTMLGLTMGVATLITVMTIVQGANLYVENKIANLGTNVFQIARTPFAVTDFNIIIKALKYKKIEMDDVRAIQEGCPACAEVGATASASVKARHEDKESTDVNYYGQTANMTSIDTREVQYGRYFTSWEADHRASVCLIGDTIVQRLFLGVDPIGKTLRIGNDEFTVIGGEGRQRARTGPGQLRDRAAAVVFGDPGTSYDQPDHQREDQRGEFRAGAGPGAADPAGEAAPRPENGE